MYFASDFTSQQLHCFFLRHNSWRMHRDDTLKVSTLKVVPPQNSPPLRGRGHLGTRLGMLICSPV